MTRFVRGKLRTRLSRRLNCDGCSCGGGSARGDQGKRDRGALGADFNGIRMSVPQSQGNRFRPRLLGGGRADVDRSVRRGVLSVCTGKVAATSVRTRVRSVCKLSMSSAAMDEVASGVLPVTGR